MSDRILYSLPGCPYCARVKQTLDALELDYETRTVPGPHSERTEVKEISGQTNVPVLVDPTNGIDALPESNDIIQYLEETYN